MNNFNENINKNTNEISKKEIGTNGKALQSQQEALNQLQAIQGERRNNLLVQKQENMASAQQTELMAQAATIGTSTMGTLQKYGMKAPPTVRKSNDIKITPNKITINNNTTNNITNGGSSNENPSKFKTWLNRTLAIQKESANKRNLEYEKRESSLAKNANKMLKRVETASRSVAETLNPQKIGTTIGNQFKILLMIFGMRFLSNHMSRILPIIQRSVDFLQDGFGKAKIFFHDAANYFGFTEEGKENIKKGGGFYNDLVRFLGGEPGKKGKSTLLDVGKIWIEDLGKMLEMKLKHMMELRGEAIKSIKFPKLDLGNMGVTLTGIAGYLGNILTALVDPNSAMHSNIKYNINTVGLSSSLSKSKNWRHENFSSNTDVGDSDVVHTEDGKRNYTLNKEYLTSTGELNGSTISQISQGRDILGAMRQAKETGQIDTARMASGFQRLQNQVDKKGLITLDPEVVNQFYNPSTLKSLIGSGDIKPQKFKYVKVKRTAEEKAREEQAYGFGEGFIRGYGANRLAGEIPGVPSIAGGLLTPELANVGSDTRTGINVLGALGWNGGFWSTMEGLNNGVEGLVNKLSSNDYTLKLVPLNDKSYGDPVKDKNGKPYVVDMYSLNKNALSVLSKQNFNTERINTGDETLLRGVRDKLIKYGGGPAKTKETFENYKKTLSSDELDKINYETVDIDTHFKTIRDMDNLREVQKAEEEDLKKKSAPYRNLENWKDLANKAVSGINDRLEYIQRTTGFGSFYSRKNGDWKGASYFGIPEPPIDNKDLKFNTKIASDTAIKNVDKRLYSPAGTPLAPPYPAKSSNKPCGYCAGYIRRAIAAGLGLGNRVFYNRLGANKDAKSYIGYLGRFGFKPLDWGNYNPRVGDVLVIGPNPGHPSGHICIKTSRGWISDFVQEDMWGGSSYRANKSGVVFRHLHPTSNGIDEETGVRDESDTNEDIYTDTLFDSEGNIIGYKTFDGNLVNTLGEKMNDTESTRVVSSASIEGLRESQKWEGSDVSGYLLDKDANKVAAPIMRSLMNELGLTREQAAGIVGNLYAESTLGTKFRLDKTIKDSNGKTSGGIAMWNGERFNNLVNFANERGTHWGDLKTQIDFLIHELKTSESRALTKLKGSKTAEESSLMWGKYFERFKGSENLNGAEHKKRVGFSKSFNKDVDLISIADQVIIEQQGNYNLNQAKQQIELASKSIKDGIVGKKVACIGDSWMCGLLGMNTSNVTSTDRSGVKVTDPKNPLFNELTSRGAKDCIGFARTGAALSDMISYTYQVLSEKPDVIIVHAGLNDYNNESSYIIDKLRRIQGAAGSTPIFFCSINNAPFIGNSSNKLNESLKSSGVNILDVRSESLIYSSDKLHLKDYKPLAKLIADRLVEGAPKYNSTLVGVNTSVLSTTDMINKSNELEHSEGAIFQLEEPFKLTTDEEYKSAIVKGDAARLYRNSESVKSEFDVAGGYKQFEKAFSELSEEQQEIYKARKAAEFFWNSLDKNYRNFDFLPEGYKSFENLFVKSSPEEREKLINNLKSISIYNKRKDELTKYNITEEEKKALTLDEYISDNDDNNIGPGKKKLGDNWKSLVNNSLVDKGKEAEFFNLLRSGNFDKAKLLVDEHLKNSQIQIDRSYGNDDNKKKEFNEAIYGNFDLLKSRLLSSEEYDSIDSKLNPLYQEFKKLNDNFESELDKASEDYENSDLSYSDLFKKRQQISDKLNARKQYLALELEKGKFNQQYLTDGFISTSENNSDLANIKIIEANKEIAKLNKEIGELKYFFDESSIGKNNKFDQFKKDGKFTSDFGGMTDRFNEYMDSKIKSGELDQYFADNYIVSNKSLEKYKKDEFNKIRNKAYEKEVEKEFQRRSALGYEVVGEDGKRTRVKGSIEDAENWRKNALEALKDAPEKITLSIKDYLRNNSDSLGLKLDKDGQNVIFDTETDRLKYLNLAASELIKQGKLNAFAYMQQMGLNDKDSKGNSIVTEDEFKSGKFKESNISIGENGDLLLNGKKESEESDQSSATWRDAMHRDQQLGLMMSDREYNMQRPVMPKKEDFITEKKIKLKKGRSHSYKYFDEKAYANALDKFEKDDEIWSKIQLKKSSKEGKLFEASQKELSGRILEEQMDLLRKAGESGFSTSVGQRSIDSDMSNDDNFNKFINSKLNGNTLSDTEKALIQTKLSNLGVGETITEVKTTLSNGGTITRLIDSKGNTIYTMVPEEVKAKRDKGLNSDKLWKQLGFSSEKAKARQDEIEAAALAYNNRQIALQEKGLSAQQIQAGLQATAYDQLARLYRLAQGEDGGISTRNDGKNLNEDQKTPDETKQ